MYTHLSIQGLTHSGYPTRLEKSLFASELRWNLDEQDIQGTILAGSLDLRNRVFSSFVFPALCTVYAKKP